MASSRDDLAAQRLRGRADGDGRAAIVINDEYLRAALPLFVKG